MKPKIKECKKFGKGGHIVLPKEDIGKKFLVLPESSKYILGNILKQYHESLESLKNPLLNEFLSKKEFETIKRIYKKVIDEPKSGYNVGIYQKFLEGSYEDLNTFKLSDIGVILNEIESKLPENLKKKLLREYYKID